MKTSQATIIMKQQYVSIIKLNGVPILPPLITAEKSKELCRYKKQAIKIELRLKREKELRLYIDQFYKSQFESKEISDSCPIEITNYLIDTDIYTLPNDKCNILQTTTDFDTVANNTKQISLPKSSNLTCNIQVSQYANNEFKLFEVFGENDIDLVVDSYSEHLKPKLLRSNSYTLETPSQVLVQHLKRNNVNNDKLDLFTTKRSWSLENVVSNSVVDRKIFSPINEQKTPIMSDIGNHPIKEFNKSKIIQIDSPLDLNSSRLSYLLDTSGTESELKDISCNLSNDGKLSDIHISDTEYQEFIENNVPLNTAVIDIVNSFDLPTQDEVNNIKEMTGLPEYHNINKSVEEIEADAELQQILSNIPEEYSKQIMELLEKQKLESIVRHKSYGKLKDDLLSENYFDTIETKNDEHTIAFSNEFLKMHVQTPENYSTPNETSPEVFRSVVNSGRTLYYTMNSMNENLSEIDVHSVNNITFNDDQDIPKNIILNKTFSNDAINETFLSRPKDIICSRQLFPEEDLKLQRRLKQEKAATILGAAGRGYLIRRIMRTERVQSLIQTIRDALMCAMQLHAETVETIVEADVELHRRCIQQVSAACEAFHEVFFNLSTSEQMSLIAVDRQKRIDKLRRPLSGSSSGLSSSKSTPRSVRNRPFSSRSSIKT